MNRFADFIQNETAVISLAITALTGVLTGPVFEMEPAAVGTITGAVAAIFNIWVRFSVYSKKGAAIVATETATQAVAALDGMQAGPPGEVSFEGTAAVNQAVRNVLGDEAAIKPPGTG